jgi:hypothetical protein
MTTLSAYHANIASGNRAATSKSQRVNNADSLELQAESENFTVTSSLIAEGYPVSEMTVAQAKSLESPPLTRVFELWTFFDNVSVFSQIMPIIKTKDLHHEVEKISQKVGFTRHAPERTRAHTLQQRRSRYSIHLNRYNIGVELLSQSLETDEGKNLYVRDLQAMRISYLESNAIRTIIELQTCQTPWRDPTKRYGNAHSLTSDTLKTALELEKSFFGIIQREAGAFELLDTLINKAQEPVQGAEGDTYIMSKSLLNFNTQVLDESKYYMYGGPEAVARFKNGPNGITQDGRGNGIVTFRCYEMDGEPPLKPLLEFVDVLTYFSTRDTRLNERYDESFESSQRTVMIFDIDRDQWVPISTRYVLENCHRFDPVTGAPYGLDNDIVNRHDVDYTNAQFNDSYHYKVQSGPGVFLRQCVFMGQIGKEHITVEQIKQKIGQHTTALMKELHKLGTASQTKRAIDEGLELLRQIEDVPLTTADGVNAGAVYLTQALEAAGGAVPGANTRSDFGNSFVTSFVPQNSDSGLDLPTSDAARAAAAIIRAPVGYGSYAGFKAIEKAYNAANKVDADFTAATGLPADVAKRAVNFLAVFNEYANQASSFFAGSLGVDPRQVSPWWKLGGSAHVIWDAVVTPQHRLPYLRGAAATPLLYSPRQLATAPGGAAFSFSNPADIKTALDLNDPSVTALKNYEATRNAEELANLDPALIPMASTNESPALANSILSNYNRSQYIASQRPGAQVGAAQLPMQGVVPTSGLASGKRSASAMSTSGRVLSAFGGAAASLREQPQKQARSTRSSTAAYSNLDIKGELSTDNFVELWDEIDSDQALDPISKMNCKLYLLSPFNLKVLLNFDAKNMAVLVSSLGFRCITLGTQSIIKVKSGQCGNQYYAYPSYRWNIDGILGVFRGQLDYWFAAKVTDPRKVFQADNVYIEQYLGGGGSQPVSDANITPVSDATSMRTERPSVYLSLEPYNRSNYSDIISITGRMRDVGSRMGVNIADGDKLDFDNAPYFNRVYGHQEQVISARAGSATFWPGSSPVLAYRELHKVWDREKRDYTKTIGGTGLIPDAWIGPGLKRTLNGSLVKPPAYTHDYLVK